MATLQPEKTKPARTDTVPVWLRVNLPAPYLERIQAAFPQCAFRQTREETDDAWLETVRFVFTDRGVKDDLAKKMSRLEFLQLSFCSAYIVFRAAPSLVERNIPVATCKGVHGYTFSELAIGLIFALAKQVPQCVVAQQQHKWPDPPMSMMASHVRDVAGATLGIIGLGTIGNAIAEKAHALGMRVIAIKRTKGTKPSYVEELWQPDALHTLLGQSDFVLSCCPDIPATTNILGEAEFAAMKRNAYLINIAPKQAVDGKLLAKVLGEKRIAGAAFDGLPFEPMPPDNPLWDVPNLLITPRLGSKGNQGMVEWNKVYPILEGNLRAWLTKQAPVNVIDPALGY